MKRYLPTLRRIQRLGERSKREFVRACDKQLLDCFSECCKNILKGNVPLKEVQLRKLRREKKNLRALALKRTSLKKKRKILQKGGLIGAVLTPALALIGSLISGFNGAR